MGFFLCLLVYHSINVVLHKKSQNYILMIDITQLTSLISAFRVETEKESISPETVGKLLQDILDLLANASTDAERQILDDWKNMLSQYVVVYDIEDANMPAPNNMFLRLHIRNLGNGSTHTSSIALAPASETKAGAMTSTHVQTLATLQSAMQQVQSAVNSLQSSIAQHGQQLFIIQSAGYVVTGIAQGNPHQSKVNLKINMHDVRTGEDYIFNESCQIAPASTEKAGVMTAAQVLSLNNAKTDITTLKSALRTIQNGLVFADGMQMRSIELNRVSFQLLGYNVVTGERDVELNTIYLPAATANGAGVMSATHAKQLEALRQAVFGSSTTGSKIKPFYHFGIVINKGNDALRLRGADELLASGYTPYLFRYSRKRNRVALGAGRKGYGAIRKGWNVLGKVDTVLIESNGTVLISKKVLKHPEYDEQEFEELAEYQHEPKFFVSDRSNETRGERYVPFGMTRIDIIANKNGIEQLRKVRLQYGIAFASYRAENRQLLDLSKLVTPIVPFKLATDSINKNSNEYRWIFER